ncbi:serine/threonine protein kinase [Saccharothrix saharensis]|uniref:non-specific serine/threonine protein kinase n=1 Tax=Saccharothrix saharensis TaxID=571190 RepID=A0A543JNG7_9PSEU|nr:serine/threonine-protein kinase [Saccharothrix saharensis]TQM84315.1 serine/threonine protein kinase [Saccharothrix saharensis]
MWDGDLTGEVVDDRYALGNLYGSGGMAEVYRAVDRRLDRKVAIKFFLGQASGEDRIRLDREARVLGELRCPGLVEVYGTGSFRGRPYFVMQPVEGGTLRRRMRGAMSPEVVAAIGAQIAGVLAHVHANDVVHRDVKPSNILLDTAGRRAYLADFGLALQGQVTRVTKSGILVGTAGYLAPEQVRGGDVLPAADVYALGLVLLECLTGRPEYPGGDTEAALSRLHREPRIPTNLPAPWTDVLTAMTASDPAKRPSAAECERLLTQAQRASAGLSPLAEVAAVRRVGVAEHEPEPKTGNRALLVGAAAAAAVLTVLGVLLLGDQSTPEHGDRAVRPTTSGVPEPVADEARNTGVAVVPGEEPSTVTVVQGASPEAPPAGNTGNTGGDTAVGTTPTSTTTAPTTTAARETEVRLPSHAPVVIVPDPGASKVTGPPTSKTRSGSSGKG